MSEFIHVKPEEIEKESFRIIGEILAEQNISLPKDQEPITKRVIHTTADFSYVDTLEYSDNAIEIAHELIKNGATIVTDTNMGLSGISKKRIGKYGCSCRCFMADEDVAKEAKEKGITRATVSVNRAFELDGPVIFAVGNAPTALIEIHRIMEETGRRPDFVIGVPVGFVNVEYSKELFRDSGIPYIINFGRKGGSNVAAAIINALTLTIED